jgi:HD superfamily phosphohydrolase
MASRPQDRPCEVTQPIFTVIRDPLWNNIQVDSEALEVLDTEPFQRLRYVRQLGHAFLVYPGATHTRFEHALGTYHLARRVLTILGGRGELEGIDPEESTAVRLAALLHDVGHYPFSHALEEAGLPLHEDLAKKHFESPDLKQALDNTGLPRWNRRLYELIAGTSPSPLAGLISGSLDLDKIEYLTRDARMCGVPYGAVDVDRLLHALTVVTVDAGRKVIGIREKGISALESLLFARYQMYRNVYWHHAVRSATAMFKRMVRTAISSSDLDPSWVAGTTDDALMERLRQLPDSELANRLYHRRLYKRTLEVPGGELSSGCGEWMSARPELVEKVENQMAKELGVPAGTVLLDYPAKSKMLAVDMPVLTRAGTVEQENGTDDRVGLHGVANGLHTSARFLRVFTAEPVQINRDAVLGIMERSPEELELALEDGNSLLKGKN